MAKDQLFTVQVEESVKTDGASESMGMHSLIFDFCHATSQPDSSVLADETTKSGKYSVFANHNADHFSGALSPIQPESTLFVKTKPNVVIPANEISEANSSEVSPETAAFKNQMSPDIPRPKRRFRELSPKTFKMIADWHRQKRSPVPRNKNEKQKAGDSDRRPRIDSAFTFDGSENSQKENFKTFNRAMRTLCRNIERLTNELLNE